MLREKQEVEDSLKLLERKLNDKERSIRVTQKRLERERLEFVQEVKKAWGQRGINEFEQVGQNHLKLQNLKVLF